ncbi:MAG: 23S rRNA (guanosine(2251)-2'-O)-methyltransferase RlmB [Ruminococcaceae bacterium]|nr:23S rRNA (guanosine(2251)-2'-O)-methyltransferase RlmB [Oscillospiraceae bacterium]
MAERAETTANQPVYGRNAVAELLKSGAEADTVLLADGLDDKTVRYFTALAKQAGAVVKTTRTAKLDELCGGRHQGVAAFVAEVAYATLDELLHAAAEKNEDPFILIADGIEDPHNLGALIRSALLCGAHGVVIPKRGAAGITPVTMKASAGAAALLPVARVANIGETVRRLKKANLFVWCADTTGTPLGKQDLSGPIALVLGSEGRGVSPLVKKLCDGAVMLPMAAAGGVDSFNVSVAGGILMYAVYSRRHS